MLEHELIGIDDGPDQVFDALAAVGTGFQVSDQLREFHLTRLSAERGEIEVADQGVVRRLTFLEAIPGPICLGYACHFGMGVFRPATATD